VRLIAAFAAHELRTQARSLRFRVIAALYAVAAAGPAALIWLRRSQVTSVIGGATYAAETLEVLPVLTAVLAFLISLDAITREQDEGAWSTVGLAGMSNAGYLLRRWLALQALLIPLTAIPLAVAAAAAVAANGPGVVSPEPFVIPWLTHVVPVALTFSALALGVGTIAGGALNAFLLGAFVLLAVPVLVNALLGGLGIRLSGPLEWLDLPRLSRSINRLTFRRPVDGWAQSFPFPVSETPFDAGVAVRQILVRAAVPVALAAIVLGLAVRYLRRTRPDVRPWRVRPDHPLRTFLKTIARLRERYTPDPAPARADLLALGIALLLTAGGSALVIGHARRFEALGRARFAAEKSAGPAPTPADVLPGAWRVEGTLGPDRRVDLQVTAEMRNQGATPRGHLAFELNPRLRIASASAGEGTLALSRSWDRLAVELTPPLPPGGRRELRFRLAGRPAEAMIDPVIFDFPSFHKRFSNHLHARFPRELIDFSTSYEAPAISPRRIRLKASDLSPIPRYQSWKLDEDLRVETESYTPQADVTVALAGLPGVFLADTCGDVDRSGRRLAGSCRLPLTELAVVGGRYQTLSPPESGTTVAVYPAHAKLGELHLAFLNGGERKLEEAWPGLADLRRMVVLEWSGDRVFDADPVGVGLATYWRDPSELPVSVLGNLVLVSEGDLTQADSLLKPEGFLAEMVASRLARRRSFAQEDSRLFRHLFRELALQRLGLGSESGAAVEGLRPGQGGVVSVPPPAEGYGVLYWSKRFPALMVGLRHRMGEEALRQAIEDLLSSRNGQRPCTRQDLYATLARHGGPDLPRFLQDNFVDGKLAEPVLEGIEFHQAPDGWRVTGRMHNRGEAQALCKVVLTTDLGPVAAMVQADGGKDGAFELRTPRRPQAVLLDPDKECHRLVPSAAPGDRIFFQGGK
jgi:hypothetical protein